MRIYTAHTCARRAPVLVREGFSWGALVFGPFWLLAHRAWIAGVLTLCLCIMIAILAPPTLTGALSLVLFWALGVLGNDFWRGSLGQRGFLLVHVIAAPDRDAALARLLERRPDLIPDAVGGVLA